MVTSNNYHGSEAGVRILKKGGNAVDAAVASAFADAVAQCQRNGGIGGGGYVVIYNAEEDHSASVYFHMRTSENAASDMFEIDAQRGYLGGYGFAATKNDENTVGYKSICVPGFVPGLSEVLERWGTMKLGEILRPAIELAQDGFRVEPTIVDAISSKAHVLARFPASTEIYLRNRYFTPQISDNIVCKDLAKTMTQLADNGTESFYGGKLAKLITANVQENGGILSQEDFAKYKPIIFSQRRATYRGYEVHFGSYAGGTTCVEMMNILEGFDLARYGQNSVQSLHLIAEAMRLAYADRQTLMGGDFDQVPVDRLESKKYAEKLRRKIRQEKAMPEIGATNPSRINESTTHISTVDEKGNMVALTYTNENTFGSGLTIPGTGILMNNMMASFNPLPGRANSIGPNKNALSNMTPTILVKDGESFMTVGAAGSRKIETTTLQVILNVIDYRMGIQKAIDAPRIRREMDMPLYLESIMPQSIIEGLRGKEHEVVVEKTRFATLNGIVREPKTRTLRGVDRFLMNQWQAKASSW
jgi:gamma-glutamyltranspeptidase/glutathione hydrolase